MACGHHVKFLAVFGFLYRNYRYKLVAPQNDLAPIPYTGRKLTNSRAVQDRLIDGQCPKEKIIELGIEIKEELAPIIFKK